jgi:hypothetical protein
MLVTLVVPVQIAERAVDSIALARPRTHFHCFHVFDVYAANQWDTLPPTPLLIRIHSHESGLLFGVQRGVWVSHGNFSDLYRVDAPIL